MKTVLVIGGGGREHAIVDALSRSAKVEKIYCAPGNAGIAAQAECVPIKDTDVAALLEFALSKDVDLTVVGPEAALAAGVVDAFREAGLKIFGHTKAATRIESSKEFAKVIMDKYGVPTSGYRSFNNYSEALAYVTSRPFPAVLKYDGLAAGKGVVIAQDIIEADATLKDMLLDEKFGGGKVVIEDFLTGPEFSFMAFVDGSRVYPMPLAQDHKRAFDGDKGPNTGGMGAYTSLPFITEEDRSFALKEVLQKTADAMVSEGTPLSGVLYGGLMKTPVGIKVIEFNARFGDPETEVVLPLMDSDIYDIFEAVASGKQAEQPVWSDDVTMGVVMASKGYPGAYEKGFGITLAEPEGAPVLGHKNILGECPQTGHASSNASSFQSIIYHMGTSLTEGKLVTSGGRVLMCVARAASVGEAKDKAYRIVEGVKCENLFYRKDIAHIAFETNQNK